MTSATNNATMSHISFSGSLSHAHVPPTDVCNVSTTRGGRSLVTLSRPYFRYVSVRKSRTAEGDNLDSLDDRALGRRGATRPPRPTRGRSAADPTGVRAVGRAGVRAGAALGLKLLTPQASWMLAYDIDYTRDKKRG